MLTSSTVSMDTDNRVAPPIPFVYWFCLQNLRRHMCCRAIKTKLIGVAASAYQCLYWPNECCHWNRINQQFVFCLFSSPNFIVDCVELLLKHASQRLRISVTRRRQDVRKNTFGVLTVLGVTSLVTGLNQISCPVILNDLRPGHDRCLDWFPGQCTSVKLLTVRRQVSKII